MSEGGQTVTINEEVDILVKVIDGNSNAFEELIYDNERRIYNLTLRMTGSAEDAKDLTQETFLKAFKSIKKFRGDCKFSVWIYRMAMNTCIDFLRGKKDAVSMTVADDGGDIKELEIPDTRFSPETEFERQELTNAINRGLLRLPEDQRQILIMRDISGMSYEMIGDVLEIAGGTVKSRLHRARRNLAATLLGDKGFSNFSTQKLLPDEDDWNISPSNSSDDAERIGGGDCE